MKPSEIIERELKMQNNLIVDKGTFEEKNPLYTNLLYSTPKEERRFEFPMEIRKKAFKVIKLFPNIIIAIGREVKEVIE